MSSRRSASSGGARSHDLLAPRQPEGLREGLCVTERWPLVIWHSDRPQDREQAQAICRRCPVLAECRAWALSIRSEDDLVGVLGGWTVGERNDLRARRQRAISAAAG